jgi:hypothetical protein
LEFSRRYEMGLCLNPYLSRLGIGLLSRHSNAAASIAHKLHHNSPTTKGLTPYLSDDLRFVRWSYLPLITKLLKESFRFLNEDPSHTLKSYWTYSNLAATARFHNRDVDIYFAPCSGGALQIYFKEVLAFEDRGIILRNKKQMWVSSGYNNNRKLTITNMEVELNSSLVKAKYFYPGFLSRLALRLLCINSLTSSLIRKYIDHVRLKSSSAINQSAAPYHKGKIEMTVNRKISFKQNCLIIIDIVNSNKFNLDKFEYITNHEISSLYNCKLQIKSQKDSIHIIKSINF